MPLLNVTLPPSPLVARAQISYSTDYDLTCEIVGKPGAFFPPILTHISLPIPVFKPTMYFRGKLVDFCSVRKWYTVEYQDGPYLADEVADGKILFKAPAKLVPKGGRVIWKAANVHQGHVTVDIFDNFENSLPVFIVFISLMQAAAFAYWCLFRLKDGERLSLYDPIAGPNWAFMKVAADFPSCESLARDWWRVLTYQFVHSGILHVTFNVAIQLVYGLPLNMVHGNLRFGVTYLLGVICGALNWVAFEGGYSAVVGCSGGVYCIFGMHLAEIATNWSLNKRGICNRWNRLFIISCILVTDIYTVLNDPSASTSYTTHAGGLVYGFLCGIILFDELEKTWFHANFSKPAAIAVAVALPLLGVHHYAFGAFPQEPVFGGTFSSYGPGSKAPCCWQLLKCGLEADAAAFDDAFSCLGDGFDLATTTRNPVLVDTCSELKAAYSEAGF